LPEKAEGFTKRSPAVLRCKPHRSMYIYIRLAVRFFARLASEHPVSSTGQAFEQSHRALLLKYINFSGGKMLWE
jgi:hypothetical protein